MKATKQNTASPTAQHRPQAAKERAGATTLSRISIRRLIANSELLIPASLISRQDTA